MLARLMFVSLVVAQFGPVHFAAAKPASVRDYGAKGDDKADDTRAFIAALQASRNVYVPAGTYRIDSIKLPQKTYLHGAGRASVIRFVPSKKAKAAIHIGSQSRLSNLSFTGTKPFQNWITGKGSMNPVMLLARGKEDIEIDRIKIEDYRHNGIWLEGCKDVRITGSLFSKLFHGIEIDACKRIHVSGNRLREMRNHGIQFWGQSNFTRMLCEDLIFANNYVYHGGSGAIWGTGARRVVMNGNVIDGAKDIGLDLEWCYDCSITGNTTRNCWNAGIALFLSCKNVSISGNSIRIDSKEGRRDGIMLTGVNRGLYRKDFGHRNISITGNTIHAEGRQRHGISIGSGYNIVCSANTMRNADILDRTGRALVLGVSTGSFKGQDPLSGVTVIPLGPLWRFAIDPKDQGVARGWFARSFDDSQWAKIRSDQPGIGWEGQGFRGENGKGYTGFAWYRAPLPKLLTRRPRFAYLHFGMTDEQSWIYLNGKQVGEHSVKSQGRAMQEIWDEPFGIEVSKYLTVGKPNDLAVRIHNAALAGGLRRPASLILSNKPLSVSQQIRAANAHRRQQVLRGAVKWPKLLRSGSKLLLRESFEKYDIGDDPSKRLWSYAAHGNEQWEGDTTYVVDETTHGVPAYDGSKAFFLEQFTYQNRYDVCAKPIIRFPRQTSGTVRLAFALFPRAGLALAFGDSKKRVLSDALLIGKDGKVRFREKGRSTISKLTVVPNRWNAVLFELKPRSKKATLTLNNVQRTSFSLKLDAIDKLRFQVSGYGSVMLDSLMVVHDDTP